LNKVLLTKGYMLVRSGRMLMLINLEDGTFRDLFSTVPLENLDSRGEDEFVSVLFTLEHVTPEEAEVEVKKLLGPCGSAVSLPKSQQVVVKDMAGRLRTIRDVLKRIEGPSGPWIVEPKAPQNQVQPAAPKTTTSPSPDPGKPEGGKTSAPNPAADVRVPPVP